MARKTTNKLKPVGLLALMPPALSPQLATLTAEIPRAGEWLYEIKLDGYCGRSSEAGAMVKA